MELTEHGIADRLARYDLRRRHDETAPEGYQYFAFYLELPGCVAQAGSPEAALAELDAIAPFFARTIVEGGAQLPVPRSERMQTNRLALGPVFVGELGDLPPHPTFSRITETTLDTAPVFQRRQLTALAEV